MLLETFGTVIAPWLGEWGAVKIASHILKNICSQLNPQEIEKALKVAITVADQQCNQLFGQSDKRFKRKFLDKYFEIKEVLEELQKPLVNQGIDLDFLVFAFEETVKNNPDPDNPINPKFIKLWLSEFKEQYFKAIGSILTFQYAKTVYLKQLVCWYDDVKFVGIDAKGQENDKSEKLAKIFVMQDVKEEKKERYGSLREADFLELGDRENRQGELSRQQRQWMALDNYAGNPFPAQDLLTKNQAKKVVVLGAPGSGKTTLLSYFSVIIAQNKSELLGLNSEVDWLPILIRMRDYVRFENLSILEYYQQFCHKSLAVPSLPGGFFEHWLEDGRALILLDGLDEIVEEGKRHELVQKIENFLGRYDQNRVMITSRPAGYRRDFFRAEEFPHYWLQPFDEPKINAFIENWYNSRTPDPEEAKRRKEDIRKAFEHNPRLHVLARNPLLLTIIALIHRYQDKLPKERYKLYHCAVQTLLTTWDTTNKQLENHHKLEYLKNDDWEDLMQNLAFWIHSHQDGIENNELEGTLIDKDELIKFVANYIKETKQIELTKAKKEAQRFLDFVRDRSGLLNEQGRDCYAFVHKTFQEYLCAQKIQREMEEDSYNFEIILDAIKNHLHDAHWREVLLLLVAQQQKKSAAKAIKAVLNNQSEYEQWLHRDLLFAGSCLAENPKGLNVADSRLVEDILARLVRLEISDKTRNKLRYQLFKVFCSLYETDFAPQCLALLKAQASKINSDRLLTYRVELGEKKTVIDELIQQLLSDSDHSVRESAARALGNLENASETVIEALLNALSDSEYGVRRYAAEALGKLGNASETVIEALLQALSDSDDEVRINAARALGKLGNASETVIEALLNALSDSNYGVRGNAAEALGQLGNASETVIEALLNALSDSNYGVRRNAAGALGKLGNASETVIEALLNALSDSDDEVRINAARALGKLGNASETVIEALLTALSDSNKWARGNAAGALGKLGNASETVIEALLTALSDSNYGVRGDAADALGQLGNASETVIEALLNALSDSEDLVRWNAAEALGELGKQSDQVKPLVVKWIQQHEDSEFVGRGIDVLWDLVNG
ncbi:NACHT domain-containing protein [Planktothrix rubescens]|uniref:NACHT domain-containing protein n=1 Tax=Planktothrix rubescens TaxID=59512 RepID=UPI0004102A70|nr:HEAT repeat domain-containing protein [Planktothrix rubescens]